MKIVACDWPIGKMANPAALALAWQIGLDGVQVSLGSLANDMQQSYKDAAKQSGVQVSSLAIGELNDFPSTHDSLGLRWH